RLIREGGRPESGHVDVRRVAADESGRMRGSPRQAVVVGIGRPHSMRSAGIAVMIEKGPQSSARRADQIEAARTMMCKVIEDGDRSVGSADPLPAFAAQRERAESDASHATVAGGGDEREPLEAFRPRVQAHALDAESAGKPGKGAVGDVD